MQYTEYSLKTLLFRNIVTKSSFLVACLILLIRMWLAFDVLVVPLFSSFGMLLFAIMCHLSSILFQLNVYCMNMDLAPLSRVHRQCTQHFVHSLNEVFENLILW